MSNKLYNMIPRIKRARDFYLYDERGDRILDLYLDKGRAINGHRPAGLSLALKNTLSRGLYAPYPSIYHDRLMKLLQREFPGFKHQGVYRSFESYLNSDGPIGDFSDPAREDKTGKNILWRPYMEVGEECTLLKITFPFPGCDVVAVLAQDDEALPPSDAIPPYVLSGLIRSWFDWKIRESKAEPESWNILDETGHWERRGPYLTPLCSREEYDDLFRYYLDRGILISPEYNHCSISAVDIREGSLKKLFKNPRG